MDRWTIRRTADLGDIRRAQFLSDRMYAVLGDAHAISWQITVLDGANAADISGSQALCYGRRSDGSTVMADAGVSGNVVSASLPPQFCALPGECVCYLAVTKDGLTLTLARLRLEVLPSAGEVVIDPGEAIPGFDDGLRALDELTDWTLTRAEVENTLAVELTDPDANSYSITFEDGSPALTLTADGEDITVEEAGA